MAMFHDGPVAAGKALGLAILHVFALLAPFHFTWHAFYVFLAGYVITGVGVTIGYHRLLAHRSFACTRGFEYILVCCGFLTLAGPPGKWVAKHRYHHTHTDGDDDCHSPQHGKWWSHVGHTWHEEELLKKLGQPSELAAQAFYQHLDRPWAVALYAIAIPVIALYAFGGIPFVLWGFALRVVVMSHVAFSVNSICHWIGFQDWKTNDCSRNNCIMGILAFGEGWHNNHHAFPRSCRHGLKSWQIDVSWYTIVLFHQLGLTHRLIYPTPGQMLEKSPSRL